MVHTYIRHGRPLHAVCVPLCQQSKIKHPAAISNVSSHTAVISNVSSHTAVVSCFNVKVVADMVSIKQMPTCEYTAGQTCKSPVVISCAYIFTFWFHPFKQMPTCEILSRPYLQVIYGHQLWAATTAATTAAATTVAHALPALAAFPVAALTPSTATTVAHALPALAAFPVTALTPSAAATAAHALPALAVFPVAALTAPTAATVADGEALHVTACCRSRCFSHCSCACCHRFVHIWGRVGTGFSRRVGSGAVEVDATQQAALRSTAAYERTL